MSSVSDIALICNIGELAVITDGSISYSGVDTPNFRALLHQIAERYPSRSALAKELDITPSRLSRALNTGDFPLNVTNCLRLAQLSGESPTEILRAAGKKDVADLIETLYGKDRTRLLSEGDRDLLDMWHTITPAARDHLRHLLDELSKHKLKRRKTA